MASPVNKAPLRRWEHQYLGDERFPVGIPRWLSYCVAHPFLDSS